MEVIPWYRFLARLLKKRELLSWPWRGRLRQQQRRWRRRRPVKVFCLAHFLFIFPPYQSSVCAVCSALVLQYFHPGLKSEWPKQSKENIWYKYDSVKCQSWMLDDKGDISVIFSHMQTQHFIRKPICNDRKIGANHGAFTICAYIIRDFPYFSSKCYL